MPQKVGKYDAEFRLAMPQTIGETDHAFDLANYIEFLESKVLNNNTLDCVIELLEECYTGHELSNPITKEAVTHLKRFRLTDDEADGRSHG